MIEKYLGREGCCAGGDCSGGGNDLVQLSEEPDDASSFANDPIAVEFFTRAISQDLSASDVFRITITSFLDAYNFDVRRVMKCCTHNVLPSGHIIPFCAYNVLYREGHVPMPELDR